MLEDFDLKFLALPDIVRHPSLFINAKDIKIKVLRSPIFTS